MNTSTARETSTLAALGWVIFSQSLFPFFGLNASTFYVPVLALAPFLLPMAPLYRFRYNRVSFTFITGSTLIFAWLTFVTFYQNSHVTHFLGYPHSYLLASTLALFLLAFAIIVNGATFRFLVRSLWLVIINGFIVAILVAFGHIESGFADYRMYWNEVRNYLFPALYIAGGFLGSFLLLVFGPKQFRLLLLVIAGLTLSALSFSLSRAALLSVILAVCGVFFLHSLKSKAFRTSYLPFVASSLLLGATTIYFTLPARTLERLTRLGNTSLLDQRAGTWTRALANNSDCFVFGCGIGHWYPAHPHNVFIQLGIDGGFIAVGLGIFLFALLPVAWCLYLLARTNEQQTLLLLYFNASLYFVLLVEFMKSHDVYRAPFFFLALALVLCSCKVASSTRRAKP